MVANPIHTFHIPVMGLAFTIDSPIRVAHYGISSVISIMDDDLIEKMNAFYSRKFGFEHREIKLGTADHRARRITSYLDLVQKIVAKNFESFKSEITSSAVAMERFMATLPLKSRFREGLAAIREKGNPIQVADYLEKYFAPGDADVNIMTKVDRDNFDKSGQMPAIFNDAHAALRGFANSRLNSSVVFSAGMHPRLYSYMEEFADFFPDRDFNLAKRIIIKVSDFRSAQVQGLFLAKKGLWVSEFRIESGLNCGGHAFATEGHLLGPILDEFNEKKNELAQSMHELLTQALSRKELPVPQSVMPLRISVQGGVGTADEHDFLLSHYKVDSVGWGSPFLLVPEATSVDEFTRRLLQDAGEDDLYISDISPLGVPFNTVRGTSAESVLNTRIINEKPGSSCPKKYLALNKEYGAEGICTASSKYQKRKIAEIDPAATAEQKREAEARITQKACLCVGLSNAALLEQDIKIKGDRSVVICPGPNIAYFNGQYSLGQMTAHIYGRSSLLQGVHRPHMFIKELKMYVDHLAGLVKNQDISPSKTALKMRENLLAGISYYETLFLRFPQLQDKQDADVSNLAQLLEKVGDCVLEKPLF